MKKWSCNATVVGGKYLGVVEAETREEAQGKADKLADAGVSLCHQCSGQCESPQITEIYVDEEDECENK